MRHQYHTQPMGLHCQLELGRQGALGRQRALGGHMGAGRRLVLRHITSTNSVTTW